MKLYRLIQKIFRPFIADVIKKDWAFNTHEFLGDEEPMICMSYFPIIFKTADLKKLRDYVENKWHQSFDDIFYDKSSRSGYYSQFNIICAYLFWHQRDDYTWSCVTPAARSMAATKDGVYT